MTTLSGGYTGRLLFVDLTEGSCRIERLTTSFAKKYIGGRGFSSRFLLDQVPAKSDAYSPENLLVIATGPLNGTPMPSVYGSDEDLWDITHYILSLIDVSKTGVVHPTSCDAHGDGR